MIRAGALAAALSVLAGAADACRLALVLAMDVSTSVDAGEDTLQRVGLATALRSDGVQAAFFASDDPVALAVFEWSGRHDQSVVQDWVLIDSPQTLDAVATTIATTPRVYRDFPTAIGYALGFAAGLLETAPTCAAQTIDISGDGENNDGFGARDAYLAFGLDGVVVNGLAIEVASDTAAPDLASYYRNTVIQGPAAFVEVADGFEDFARAMEAKLIRELSAKVIGHVAPDHSDTNG